MKLNLGNIVCNSFPDCQIGLNVCLNQPTNPTKIAFNNSTLMDLLGGILSIIIFPGFVLYIYHKIVTAFNQG